MGEQNSLDAKSFQEAIAPFRTMFIMPTEMNLTDEELAVMPHFLNPAMPSQASTADAAVKIASADPSFAGTMVFYEMLGFDAPTIARIMAERRRQLGASFLTGLTDEAV